MRYYVEINGESSLDIQGLMIQSLPSISKPLMRSKQETIDGRDGDIVTKLGYSAYDKTLKIGLWGNYDINEVIAFFNQEGTITFSNEPDKYYRFTILNREDYVSQLDKFRTCTIALHCQPYKYKLNEEPEELENEYVEQEGTSLTFSNTLVAPMNIDLKGNTLQNGTPTPSSPIPVNNVSGDNQVLVRGKNLFNIQTLVKGRLDNGVISYASNTTDLTLNENSFSFTTNANYRGVTSDFIKVEETEYIMHCTQPSTLAIIVACYDKNKTYLRDASISYIPKHNNQSKISIQSDVAFIRIYIYLSQAGTITIENPQLEKSFIPSTYEAYNGTTYNIDLPVENLLDVSKGRLGSYGYDFTNSNGNLVVNGTASSAVDFYFCIAGQYNDDLINYLNNKSATYTLSNDKGYEMFFRLSSGYKQTTATITPQDTIINCFIRIPAGTYNDLTIKVQLEQGNKANSFTPNGTTPIELNKIGTYQDRPFKAVNGDKFYDSLDNSTKQTLTYGKWYLHKEIKKLDMSTIIDWVKTDDGSFFKSGFVDTYGIKRDTLLSNIFQYSTENWYDNGYFGIASSGNMWVKTGDSSLTTATAFTNWLSNKGAIMYGILSTPTNTEITYTPLIEQLESIKNAMSKEGTTNVNQVNNDAPFIITASVLSGTDSITLTNEGNTTSKPTLTITGSGVVGVYLENIQMFNISLGTNETIIIDTENMEAYYGSQLKNRQVTGDYSKFALQSGTNNLKFTGVVTNVEITNYNRWI